jgi:hypothetical protein
LKDDGAKVERLVLLLLLGTDAHHRSDNQRGLKAIHKLNTHPSERKDAKFAETHEADEHKIGQKIRCADNRLIRQRPEFSSRKLPENAIPDSLTERGFRVHSASSCFVLIAILRCPAECTNASAGRVTLMLFAVQTKGFTPYAKFYFST